MNWNDMDKTLLAQWQKVGQFRNKHVSIGAGANVKLSATSGVAFGRTYDKNGVTDQAAAVIGCNKNSSVTVDVSTLWEDGSYVINTYDNSSSVVTDGKVTFNSGANGTILMENADGQPLVSITGEPKFYGTEQVTVSLKECDSAKVSVDGGNKFVVKDGDTFTIGQTAYKNDTIEVTVEATNDKASSEAKFTFLKLGENDEKPTTSPTQSTTVPVRQQVRHQSLQSRAQQALRMFTLGQVQAQHSTVHGRVKRQQPFQVRQTHMNSHFLFQPTSHSALFSTTAAAHSQAISQVFMTVLFSKFRTATTHRLRQ